MRQRPQALQLRRSARAALQLRRARLVLVQQLLQRVLVAGVASGEGVQCLRRIGRLAQACQFSLSDIGMTIRRASTRRDYRDA